MNASTAAPFNRPTRVRAARRALTGVAIATAVVASVATTALASPTGSGSVTAPTTLTAGTSAQVSTTVTLNFEAADNVGVARVIFRVISPVSPSDAGVTLALVSTSGKITASNCTVEAGGILIVCTWDSPPVSGESATITATMTANASAVGTWQLLSSVTFLDNATPPVAIGNAGGPIQTVAIDVQAPTPTTVTPTTVTPTTVTPTTVTPTTVTPTTVAPALPATGGSDTTAMAILAFALCALGITSLRLARR